MCFRYLDYEQQYPAQPKEIRKHLFKLLHRALQVDTASRDRLAVMRLGTKSEKDEVRELVSRLRVIMSGRGDPWVLRGCTTLQSSWYRRHWSL